MKVDFRLLTLALSAVALTSTVSAQVLIESGGHEPVVQLENRKDVEGLASAGSTFRESTSGESVNTVGSASVVRLAKTKRLAVLTAAHVVGGTDIWIEIGKKRIKPKSVWIDNDRDIAVLDLGNYKLASKTPEAIQFDNEKLTVAPTFMKGIENETTPMVMIAYYQPQHALGFALQPWVDPGVESAYTRSITRVPVVSMSEDHQMVRIYNKVTSGASGSVVLDLRERAVAGLIVQSHYYFSETYLVAPTVLTAHFNAFLKGQRGATSETQWKMRNHLAYRVFADGTEEASFTTVPTSGVLGTPGAGVIGQPGNGVIGQPAGAKSFQPWAEDPRAVFKFYKIEPGIVWHNESIVGFSVKRKSELMKEWPAQFTLLAEPEAARFLKEHETEFEVTPIGRDVDYVELLRSRLSMAPLTKESVKLNCLYGPAARANEFDMWEPDQINVEVMKDSVHVKVKAYARMNRKSWQLEDDEIEFTLGKNGAPPGETGFVPVLETKSAKTGEIYYVDLRQFFFADYSQLVRPMTDWSKENAPFEQNRMNFTDQLSTVGFSVRNANSGAEFTYGFSK